MTVRELMAKLSQLDPELEVLCYTEDRDLVPAKHRFRIAEIDDISVAEGEKRRGDDHVPTLAFRKSELSEKLVLINVTGEA